LAIIRASTFGRLRRSRFAIPDLQPGKRNIEFSIARPYNSFRAERQNFIFL
jgi:hypothetical protein